MSEEVISRDDLFRLPEYSCSLPTGTVVGKKWRKNVHAYRYLRRLPEVPVELHEWKIGEYIDDSDPGMIGIKWAWAVDENHDPHRGVDDRIY